jgi:hypothetical protein
MLSHGCAWERIAALRTHSMATATSATTITLKPKYTRQSVDGGVRRRKLGKE